MDPSGGVTSYLFTQGVLGIAVIVLGWVCLKLYNSRETERTAHALEVKQLQKEKEDIIEARRVESNATTKEVLEVLQSNSQSNTLLATKIEAVRVTEGVISMGLFGRKKNTEAIEPIVVKDTPIKDPIVEIIANQEAKKEVIEKAKKASSDLNELLVQNGFTIKIYLAAGGKHPNAEKGK